MQFNTTWYDAATNKPLPEGANEQDYTTYSVSKCDCGALVFVSEPGTSQYAECRRGHRWQYNFDPDRPGWMQLQ